ncbi:putative tyrosine specific protein phosphatase [Trypanosoma vivax]|nr:putative tyrosine specific protein phosphatase [Trypanosoma vivax]
MLSAQAQLERLQREFVQLQRHENPRTIDFTTSLRNKHKNRYVDILANESTIYPTRIKSGAKSSVSGCYINGNLIDVGLPHKFVACQAPVPDGIADFLKILCDEKIDVVIMLTRLQEGGVLKADRYWPEEDEQSVSFYDPKTGSVRVLRDSEHPYEVDTALEITRRRLVIQLPDNSTHQILHVQYTGWPDFGVPRSAASFEALLSIIKSNTTDKPVFVHCSAGIGRTGTLIGAYAALTHMEQGSLVDTKVFDIVASMKQQRYGMVQRVEQYAVIYMTLLTRLGVSVAPLEALLDEKLGAPTPTRGRR